MGITLGKQECRRYHYPCSTNIPPHCKGAQAQSRQRAALTTWEARVGAGMLWEGIGSWGRTELSTKGGAKDTTICLKVQKTGAESEQEMKTWFCSRNNTEASPREARKMVEAPQVGLKCPCLCGSRTSNAWGSDMKEIQMLNQLCCFLKERRNREQGGGGTVNPPLGDSS